MWSRPRCVGGWNGWYRARGTWTVSVRPVQRRWSRATGTWTDLASLGSMGALIRGALVRGRVAHPSPLTDRAVVRPAATALAGACQMVVPAKGLPLGIFECPGVWPLALAFALRGLALAPLGGWSHPFAARVLAALGRLVPLGLPDRGPGFVGYCYSIHRPPSARRGGHGGALRGPE